MAFLNWCIIINCTKGNFKFFAGQKKNLKKKKKLYVCASTEVTISFLSLFDLEDKTADIVYLKTFSILFE